jgi:hypothetical protein
LVPGQKKRTFNKELKRREEAQKLQQDLEDRKQKQERRRREIVLEEMKERINGAEVRLEWMSENMTEIEGGWNVNWSKDGSNVHIF